MKRADYDTDMQNLINQLSKGHNYCWNQIYVISSDTHWAKFYLDTLANYENKVYFINDNENLKDKMGLQKLKTLDSGINVFQKKY